MANLFTSLAGPAGTREGSQSLRLMQEEGMDSLFLLLGASMMGECNVGLHKVAWTWTQ
jgi:hypothetical protein